MARDHHTYPPVGHCIYCGETDRALSKEHIIPYALNGNWVLPKASCPDCQKKTQKIEEVCLHEKYGMFAALRRRFKMQSRTGSTSKKEFLAEVGGPFGIRDLVPFESDGFPAAAIGVRMPPAGVLLGIEPANEFNGHVLFRTSMPSQNFTRRAMLQGQTRPVKIASFWPTAFLQFIAKIGYSFAAAEIGTKGLLPMLADVILGKTDKSPYLVGGGGINDELERGVLLPEAPNIEMGSGFGFGVHDGKIIRPTPADVTNIRTDYGHRLDVHTLSTTTNPSMVFTVVIVHLFGCMGMPKYHVVVGQRQLND